MFLILKLNLKIQILPTQMANYKTCSLISWLNKRFWCSKLKRDSNKNFIIFTKVLFLLSQFRIPIPNHPLLFWKTFRFIESDTSPKPSSSNANHITLRNGKEVEGPSQPLVVEENSESNSEPNSPSTIPSSSKNPIPFPEALNKRRGKPQPDFKEIQELFEKIQFHLPLLKDLEHIPTYARYLKKIYTHSRKPRTCKSKRPITHTISSFINLPPKKTDPGAPIVTCKLVTLNLQILSWMMEPQSTFFLRLFIKALLSDLWFLPTWTFTWQTRQLRNQGAI